MKHALGVSSSSCMRSRSAPACVPAHQLHTLCYSSLVASHQCYRDTVCSAAWQRSTKHLLWSYRHCQTSGSNQRAGMRVASTSVHRVNMRFLQPVCLHACWPLLANPTNILLRHYRQSRPGSAAVYDYTSPKTLLKVGDLPGLALVPLRGGEHAGESPLA